MFSTMSPMRIARSETRPESLQTYVRAFLIPERRGSVVVGDDGRTARGTAASCLSACLRATHSFLC